MLSGGYDIAHLFVGATSCALVDRGQACTWFGGPTTQLALNEAAAHIRPKSRVNVWLSGALARPFALEAVQGLKRADDARALAKARAAEETGLQGPCRVVLERWREAETLTGVAAQEEVIAAVENSLADRKCRVENFRPWWSAVAFDGDACQGFGLVAVQDPDSMVVLVGDDTRIETALTVVPAPSGEKRDALLNRLKASTGGVRQRYGVFLGELEPSRPIGPPFSMVWEEFE